MAEQDLLPSNRVQRKEAQQWLPVKAVLILLCTLLMVSEKTKHYGNVVIHIHLVVSFYFPKDEGEDLLQ